MGLVMSKPVLINGGYYLRVRVPSDILRQVKGTILSVPVDGKPRSVTINDQVKLSLSTKDSREAKARFVTAMAAIEAHWEAVRQGPQPLSHKQSLAVAGAVRWAWVQALDDDPGAPELWASVQKHNEAALAGRLSPLRIPNGGQVEHDLEARFGQITDAFLRVNSVQVQKASRAKLLQHVASAMTEAAAVNEAKARGDYSDSGETQKYPALEPSPAPPSVQPNDPQTLQGVIDLEVKTRAAGQDRAMPESW